MGVGICIEILLKSIANNSSQKEILRDFGLSFNNTKELLAHLILIAEDSSVLDRLRLKSKELDDDIASIRKEQFDALNL